MRIPLFTSMLLDNILVLPHSINKLQGMFKAYDEMMWTLCSWFKFTHFQVMTFVIYSLCKPYLRTDKNKTHPTGSEKKHTFK